MQGKADEVRRYAVRVFYDGRGYYGFQPQKDKPTVGGAIIKALLDSGLISDPKEFKFGAASRTDRGVSALAQTIAFNTKEKFTVGRLNAYLPADIRAWAWREVPLNFNPRKAALERVYLYTVPYHGENLEPMLEASKLLTSSEVLNYGFKPLRRIEINLVGEFLVFRFAAKGFTRGFIRRLVSALLKVGSGRIRLEEFTDRLRSEGLSRLGLPLVRSEPLMLLWVDYGFSFNIEAKVVEEIIDKVSLEASRLWTLKECLKTLSGTIRV